VRLWSETATLPCIASFNEDHLHLVRRDQSTVFFTFQIAAQLLAWHVYNGMLIMRVLYQESTTSKMEIKKLFVSTRASS